jgi:hypothetical protein
VHQNWGAYKHLEKLALFLRNDSQQTKNWEKGEIGDRVVSKKLEAAVRQNTGIILHDLRRTKSKANIDHIVVNSKGDIEVKLSGIFAASPRRLMIGGRDQTKLVQGVNRQVAAVKNVLSDAGLEMFVEGVLCFVVPPWKIFIVLVKSNGIFLASNRGIGKLLSGIGTYTEIEVERAATNLLRAFPLNLLNLVAEEIGREARENPKRSYGRTEFGLEVPD